MLLWLWIGVLKQPKGMGKESGEQLGLGLVILAEAEKQGEESPGCEISVEGVPSRVVGRGRSGSGELKVGEGGMQVVIRLKIAGESEGQSRPEDASRVAESSR